MSENPGEAIRASLIAIARAYASATGLALATVSRKFHGQQSFLTEFEAGECSITGGKLDSMIEKFRAEWPAGTPWPKLDAIRITGPGRKISKIVGDTPANV